jgi:photosystem II stability/assembly factor-like uncharacterized protein
MLIVIFINNEANAQWTKVATGIPLGFAYDGTYIYAGFYGGLFVPGDTTASRNILRSSDNGTNWENVSNGLFSHSVYSLKVYTLTVKSNKLFAGTNNGIFVSSDQGHSWAQQNFDPSKGDVHCFLVVDSIIFAGTIPCGIFHSTDDGNTWTSANNGLTYNTESKNIYALTRIGSTLFAGSWLAGISLSTNNGDSWTHCYSSYNWEVNSFAVIDSTLFAGLEAGSVFRSTNMGLTWTRCDNGLTDSVTHYDLDVISLAVSGENLLAGTSLHGIYFSTNMGNSWVPINNNYGPEDISFSDVRSIALINNYIFIGTEIGIWRRLLSEITDIKKDIPIIPKEFMLEQNYPNPFNPTTIINFQIPEDGFVTLKVYDVLGREVASLVNADKKAGYYSCDFDASKLSSGVYIYKITANNFVQSKKMLLVK